MSKTLSIVVNYKTDDLLKKFLESYKEFVYNPGDVLLVVDIEGGSAMSDNWEICSDMEVWWDTVNENIGYARAVNSSVRWAQDDEMDFDNIAIFNADTEFTNPFCFQSCVDLLDSSPDIAIVGPLQYDGFGRVTHAGILGTNDRPFHRGWKSFVNDSFRDVIDGVTVSGSAYFIKRSVWEELTSDEGFAELNGLPSGAFLNTDLYYEETWCSYFARYKGYRVVYNGEAEMIHHHDSSPNPSKDQKIMKSKKQFAAACDRFGIIHD